VIPIFNQDGHQAKSRKKGDENLKKSSPILTYTKAAIDN
jgi:hypothetical protein